MRAQPLLIVATLLATPAASQAVALQPPPPASLSDADVAAWTKTYITAPAFSWIGSVSNSIELMSTTSFSVTSASTIRTWKRVEFFQGTPAATVIVRSMLVAVDVDCHEDKIRYLSYQAFPYNNLQGTATGENEQSPEWIFAAPGTAAVLEVNYVCDLVRAAAKQADQPQPGAAPQAVPNVQWTTQAPAPQ